MKRRSFLGTGLVGLGATAATARAARAEVGAGCFPRVRVASVGQLVEEQAIHFSYPDDEHTCVVLKIGEPAEGGLGPDGDIVAFSTICPHMGCSLADRVAREHPGFLGPCRCHFSLFDLRRSGALLQGQATRPLARVSLEIEDEAIYAVGVLGGVFGPSAASGGGR